MRQLYESKSVGYTQNTIHYFLHKKKLALNTFSKSAQDPDRPKVGDPMEVHAAWLWNHILQFDYPVSESSSYARFFTMKPVDEGVKKFPRPYHGMPHACFVSLMQQVFISLLSIPDFQNDLYALSAAELQYPQLLPILGLFHDSGREADEADKWELDSAVFAYQYLHEVLGVAKETARTLAEMILNKDYNLGYNRNQPQKLKLNISEGGVFSLTAYPVQEMDQKKYRATIALHEADTFAILRARNVFEAHYLDASQVAYESDSLLERVLTHILSVMRSLVDLMGETRNARRVEVQKAFFAADGYQKIYNLIQSHPQFHLLRALLRHDVHSVADLQACLEEHPFPIHSDLEQLLTVSAKAGKVFLRGVITPTEISKKIPKNTMSGAESECFHTAIGNRNRSTTLLQPGHTPYAPWGFIGQADQFKLIALGDANTGMTDKLIDRVQLSKEEQARVFKRIPWGGYELSCGDGPTVPSFLYCEAIVDKISEFDAIFYTTDPTRAGFVYYSKVRHSAHVGLIMAHYLQQVYLRMHPQQKKLPIIHLSSLHGDMQEVDVSMEKLLDAWRQLFANALVENMTLNEPYGEPLLPTYCGDMSDEVLLNYVLLEDSIGVFRLYDDADLFKYYDQELIQQLRIMIADFKHNTDIFYNECVTNVLKQSPEQIFTLGRSPLQLLQRADVSDFYFNHYLTKIIASAEKLIQSVADDAQIDWYQRVGMSYVFRDNQQFKKRIDDIKAELKWLDHQYDHCEQVMLMRQLIDKLKAAAFDSLYVSTTQYVEAALSQQSTKMHTMDHHSLKQITYSLKEFLTGEEQAAQIYAQLDRLVSFNLQHIVEEISEKQVMSAHAFSNFNAIVDCLLKYFDKKQMPSVAKLLSTQVLVLLETIEINYKETEKSILLAKLASFAMDTDLSYLRMILECSFFMGDRVLFVVDAYADHFKRMPQLFSLLLTIIQQNHDKFSSAFESAVVGYVKLIVGLIHKSEKKALTVQESELIKETFSYYFMQKACLDTAEKCLAHVLLSYSQLKNTHIGVPYVNSTLNFDQMLHDGKLPLTDMCCDTLVQAMLSIPLADFKTHRIHEILHYIPLSDEQRCMIQRQLERPEYNDLSREVIAPCAQLHASIFQSAPMKGVIVQDSVLLADDAAEEAAVQLM